MTFSEREFSEYDGEPQELYWFMRGADSWLYASGPIPVQFDSQTYSPLAGLSRSAIKDSRERGRAQMTVTVPRDSAIATQFVAFPSQDALWLNLYQIHAGEADYSLAWQGRVRNAEFRGNTCTLTLDTLLATTKREALRHLYQNQCNHFTFDAGCGLVEGDYSNAATLISVDGVTLTADDSQDAGYYIAGQVKLANGDRRMVVNDTKSGSTHTLTLHAPFEALEAGAAVTLIGGACRHTFDTCPIQGNYGGYPKVPRKNPFRSII